MPKTRSVVAEARDGDLLRAHVVEPPGCGARLRGVLVTWFWRLVWVLVGVVIGVIVE